MDTAESSRGIPRWILTVVVGRRPWLTLARLAVLIVGTWAVFTFVLTPPIRVTGISMLPTCHDGQINFLNRLAYFHHDPQRFDIVGVHFKGTEGNSLMYLKRIVGLPGESVSFVDGKLYIDGVPQDEPFENGSCDWNMPPVKLGFDEYYLVGDNRSMDITLHEQGVALRRQIVGRILLKPGS